MKLYRLSLYALLLTLVLSSCFEEPDFPVEPRLTGKPEIIFKEMEGPDSLIIRVEFEDGDGDLGLLGSGADIDTPYNEISVIERNGQPVIFDPNDPSLPDFSCENYLFPAKGDSLIVDGWIIKDTVQVRFNETGRNFDIELLVKRQDEYVEYNFRKERCVVPLGGRFPPLKEDFNDKKPLKGVIEYRQVSSGILPLFRNDSLKIRVKIRDRALHESNVIESDPFTLRGIEQ